MTTNEVVETPVENGIEQWSNLSNWIHCICVVTFDLEIGQALECIYPEDVTLTKHEISNICYLALPDSNSGCVGDTNFVVRLKGTSLISELTPKQLSYNACCPVPFQVNAGFYWGYVYFRQVKDVSLPRGYFQKSVVILSRFPFINLFTEVSRLVAPEYFDNGEATFEAACFNMNCWPPPVPGKALNLPLLGSVLQIYIPIQSTLWRPTDVPNGISRIQCIIDDLNIFEVLEPVLSHVQLLWELVLTSEPIVVMASSPSSCSQLVLALTKLIYPLKFCADFRPYFTIHDHEFKQITSKMKTPPPIILGVTNPFFAKTLHHWPHTIKLSEDNGISTIRDQKYKLKKNDNLKMLDNVPGVYTLYKPFLQKDKHAIKKIILNSKRPAEAQVALLRRHLLELTESFIFPLERYIATLLPLHKNISPFKAAPSPLPFNPDDFFATLETSGPQLTSGIKGDWVGLYKKFFRSPNFNGWFDMRYTELALKLHASQLEVLSKADFKLWTQGKPEVEVVDMVLKLKSKLSKCHERNITISDTTKEKLAQKIQDIIDSLQDDIKEILQVT